MATTVRLTITSEGDLTQRDVSNAVRRALSGTDTLVPGTKSVIKGVKVAVKEGVATPFRTPQTHIREWAAQNGYTVGKRGRFSAALLAAYAEANK